MQSVPPIWRILRETWEWMDFQLNDDTHVDDKSIGDRLPWWEVLVDRWMQREGILSIV